MQHKSRHNALYKPLTVALMVVVLCLALALALTAGASPGIGISVNPEMQHSSPGRSVEYTITVYNYNPVDRSITLEIDEGNCNVTWFGWFGNHVFVPAHGVRSVSMVISPGSDTNGGTYKWSAIARTTEEAISAIATLEVQGYDYACVTHVAGEGYFTMDRRVRSITDEYKDLQFAVDIDKHFECKGEIEGFVNDEFLIEGALGDNPNFVHESAVGNYAAIDPGDYLSGDERLRSSFVFGGTGTKVYETYDVQTMDARLEDIYLHSTGNQRYTSELTTMNDFGGYLLIDAKQSVPGYKYITDTEEYWGNFTMSKHLVFRRPDEFDFKP